MTTPFDHHDAALLTVCGYVLTHHPADWEDIGGPENGPSMVGGPAYDEWTLGDHYIMVADGEVVDSGVYPPDMALPF